MIDVIIYKIYVNRILGNNYKKIVKKVSTLNYKTLLERHEFQKL